MPRRGPEAPRSVLRTVHRRTVSSFSLAVEAAAGRGPSLGALTSDSCPGWPVLALILQRRLEMRNIRAWEPRSAVSCPSSH